MVVPVKKSLNMEKVKECVGNNQKLDINHNEKTLIVVGNNCRIQLSENSGLVRVVGNTCELSVQKGNGNIEYVGNQGKIILGSSVPEANVSYIGNNGVVTNMNSTLKTKFDSNTESNHCKHCDTRQTTAHMACCYELCSNIQISSCNNVTIGNEIGKTTATSDFVPVAIPQIGTSRLKNLPKLVKRRAK